MEHDEIRDAFLALHGEVTELLSEVPSKRSRWTAFVRRWQLRNLENRLAALSQRFDVLDSQLTRHAKLPKDYNAFRTTATLDLYGAVSEAVRAKLSETEATLGSLRCQAHSPAWLAMALVGLAVAIGLIVGIVVLAL